MPFVLSPNVDSASSLQNWYRWHTTLHYHSTLLSAISIFFISPSVPCTCNFLDILLILYSYLGISCPFKKGSERCYISCKCLTVFFFMWTHTKEIFHSLNCFYFLGCWVRKMISVNILITMPTLLDWILKFYASSWFYYYHLLLFYRLKVKQFWGNFSKITKLRSNEKTGWLKPSFDDLSHLFLFLYHIQQ